MCSLIKGEGVHEGAKAVLEAPKASPLPSSAYAFKASP